MTAPTDRQGMVWRLSHRADPFARQIADRHYNRQKIGTLAEHHRACLEYDE